LWHHWSAERSSLLLLFLSRIHGALSRRGRKNWNGSTGSTRLVPPCIPTYPNIHFTATRCNASLVDRWTWKLNRKQRLAPSLIFRSADSRLFVFLVWI
jgi:hypothetical protein